jgi:hypothetical protein
MRTDSAAATQAPVVSSVGNINYTYGEEHILLEQGSQFCFLIGVRERYPLILKVVASLVVDENVLVKILDGKSGSA